MGKTVVAQALVQRLKLPEQDSRSSLETLQEYFANKHLLLVLERKAVNPAYALAHNRLAATLLSCVRSYSSTWQIYWDKAAQLQAEIESEIPTEMLAAAIARGQNAPVEELMTILLEAI